MPNFLQIYNEMSAGSPKAEPQSPQDASVLGVGFVLYDWGTAALLVQFCVDGYNSTQMSCQN